VEPATAPFLATYEALVARRASREPVAYIRGTQEFWGREFLVSPAVLIPRPDTELIVELASEYLRTRPRAVVVDVGTGCGCIAISLALEHAETSVHATDISRDALDLARANAERLHADRRVRFMHGSHLADAPRPIDLLVANPPYVAERERPVLAPEVRNHEPAVALYGGPDGWREIRQLLQQAGAALAPGGLFLMELGYAQSEQLPVEMEAASGLRLERIAEDLQGVPRVALLRTKNEERRTKNEN
jgi:release factor glutamine methyltransferase